MSCIIDPSKYVLLCYRGTNLAIQSIPSPYFDHYCAWKFKFALYISHWTHLDSLWVRVQLGGVRVHKTRVRVHSAWVRVHRGGVRVRVRVHKGRVRVRGLGLGLTYWVWVRVRTRSNTDSQLCKLLIPIVTQSYTGRVTTVRYTVGFSKLWEVLKQDHLPNVSKLNLGFSSHRLFLLQDLKLTTTLDGWKMLRGHLLGGGRGILLYTIHRLDA